MPTATNELIRGTSSTVQWLGPYEFVEVINVKGVTGSNFKEIEESARSAAGVASLGTAHPDKTTYYLRKVYTELITPTDVKIYATYRAYPDTVYRFEVLGGLNAKTVNYDYDGNPLLLQKPASLSDDTEPDYYIEDANILAPQTIVRLSTLGFAGPSASSAVADSIKYTGLVNSNIYLGKDRYTWLCTRFSLVDEGRGLGALSWNRVVELQYDPDGWDVTKSYRLSSGIVYYDQDANSEKTFEVYGEVVFPSNWY